MAFLSSPVCGHTQTGFSFLDAASLCEKPHTIGTAPGCSILRNTEGVQPLQCLNWRMK